MQHSGILDTVMLQFGISQLLCGVAPPVVTGRCTKTSRDARGPRRAGLARGCCLRAISRPIQTERESEGGRAGGWVGLVAGAMQ